MCAAGHAEQKRIDGVARNREIAAPIASGDRKGVAGRLRKITGIDNLARSGRSASEPDLVPAHAKVTEKPVKAEFLQIVLRDLDELRFDLDLLRRVGARLLHERIDQFKIVLRIPHNQAAALRKEIRARARRKTHALRGKKIPRRFPSHELTAPRRFLCILARPGRGAASHCARRGLGK